MRHVVIGGGIAGVTCAEALATLRPQDSVVIVTPTALVKQIINFKKLSRNLEEFDIVEKSLDSANYPNLRIVQNSVSRIDLTARSVVCADGMQIPYDRVCVCSGARPRLVCEGNPHVVGVRDTESARDLKRRLSGARRVLIVGNGGIALELAHKIHSCDVVWAIRDVDIGTTFLDAGAAKFLIDEAMARRAASPKAAPTMGTDDRTVAGSDAGDGEMTGAALPGTALGPQWHAGMDLRGTGRGSLRVETGCEVATVELCDAGAEYPVRVVLTNGVVVDCDFVVSATGVTPNTEFCGPEFAKATDGGLAVDRSFRTSVPDVFAAGDACTAEWSSEHWFQMRLWAQARQMAHAAAVAMTGGDVSADFSFELFAHVTTFFGRKVVLLGRFNAQGLDKTEALVRVTRGDEYVKCVMTAADGRMRGAVLVGDTDLEETFENLILDGLDLRGLWDQLLDPDVDIEDYFD